MNDPGDKTVGLHDRTGALLMLDKKERKLLKELLVAALDSADTRERIERSLGVEYVDIAEGLLNNLGG